MSHVVIFCVACCDVRHVASYLCVAKINNFYESAKFRPANLFFLTKVISIVTTQHLMHE